MAWAVLRVVDGDTIEIDTPKGPRPFRVAAVYYDYSSDRGMAVMHRTTFQKYFGDLAPTGVAAYLKAMKMH